uniref:Uncharacterized protein n=1 Tax=Kalanchoe fedtschenkoi TaxID=63787 RepID=A0A7N0V612_KALFE
MGGEAVKIRMLYRLLLKAVKKHHGVEDYKKHFKPFVAMQFRKDAPHLDRRIKLAEDYILQLNKCTAKDMFAPYNNMMETSQELKKQIDKSIDDGFQKQQSVGPQSARRQS